MPSPQWRTFAPGPLDFPRGAARPLNDSPREPVSFSVGDGFKFGCGFMLAVAISALGALVLLSLMILLATVMGADWLAFFRR
jgi:hypothetical protein